MADALLPTGGRSREEIAKIEIGVTTISRSTAWLLVAAFLLLIFTVPAIELLGGAESTTTWSHLTNIPLGIRERLAGAATPWARTLAVNRGMLSGLQEFERGLERESRVGRTLRPYAQLLLTRWLGGGNERVYPGQPGWVFYRPDVEYVTNPGFLEPAQLRLRLASAPEWTTPPQPDPRPALLQFKRDLDARGIALVVVPTPGKPTIHPERLAPRLENAAVPIHNPSFEAFVRDLERAGVIVFDPSPALAVERRAAPRYLATDTHWRPEAMEAAADAVAALIAARVPLPGVPDPGYRLERSELRYAGDTARMLDLPGASAIYLPDLVFPSIVRQRDGAPWRPTRDADVLVLGDSFSNIFSRPLRDLHAGAAGFIEHLSYALGRPVDRIVQDGDGAYATREGLQRDAVRLIGKRLVVYQFAMRELTIGDWKVLPIAR